MRRVWMVKGLMIISIPTIVTLIVGYACAWAPIYFPDQSTTVGQPIDRVFSVAGGCLYSVNATTPVFGDDGVAEIILEKSSHVKVVGTMTVDGVGWLQIAMPNAAYSSDTFAYMEAQYAENSDVGCSVSEVTPLDIKFITTVLPSKIRSVTERKP